MPQRVPAGMWHVIYSVSDGVKNWSFQFLEVFKRQSEVKAKSNHRLRERCPMDLDSPLTFSVKNTERHQINGILRCLTKCCNYYPVAAGNISASEVSPKFLSAASPLIFCHGFDSTFSNLNIVEQNSMDLVQRCDR